MTFGIASKFRLLIAATVSLTCVTVAMFLIQDHSTQMSRVELGTLEEKLTSEARQLELAFREIANDARFLAHTESIEGLIRAHDTLRDSPTRSSTERDLRSRLAGLFEGMLKSKPHYVAIRFIGAADEGREVVRVDRTFGGSVRVVGAELQHKGDRDYFIESIDLDPSQTYFSEINLNRERGEVSVPHRAMLRTAVAVRTSDEQPFGIIVINMDFSSFAKDLYGASAAEHSFYITNRNGYFLFHPDYRRTFGFDLGHEGRIQTDFPTLSGLFEGSADGVLVHRSSDARNLTLARRIAPFPDDASRFLGFAVTYDRLDRIVAASDHRLWGFLIVACLVVLGSALAYLATNFILRPLRAVTEAVEAEADGHPDLPLPVERSDEVGALARAFRAKVSALRNREARIQAIVEGAVDAILTIDARGTVKSFNQASERIFGYTASEVIGKNVSMLMPSPDHESHDGYLSRYLATGEHRVIGVGRDVQGKRKDGSIVDLHLSVSQLILDGEVLFTGILQDITLRKQAEQEIVETNKALEAANIELDSFVYSASHDVRAPLRSIIGLVERCEKAVERGAHDKIGQEYLPRIRNSTEKLDRLVVDLLAISRAERMSYEAVEVDFEDLIEDCYQQLDQMEGAGDVQLRTDVRVTQPCRLEVVRLQQVLNNLLSNSIKYRDVEKGLCELDVWVRTVEPDGVELIVKDNGVGIQEKEYRDVFKMFSRGAHETFGTGLGLYLVEKQIIKMGGTIDYQTSSAGTEFTLRLPNKREVSDGSI